MCMCVCVTVKAEQMLHWAFHFVDFVCSSVLTIAYSILSSTHRYMAFSSSWCVLGMRNIRFVNSIIISVVSKVAFIFVFGAHVVHLAQGRNGCRMRCRAYSLFVNGSNFSESMPNFSSTNALDCPEYWRRGWVRRRAEQQKRQNMCTA